tara:strand:+ start:595 stop:831 length:237 start_codon:yes stop_codon:yes gene_type:complete
MIISIAIITKGGITACARCPVNWSRLSILKLGRIKYSSVNGVAEKSPKKHRLHQDHEVVKLHFLPENIFDDSHWPLCS